VCGPERSARYICKGMISTARGYERNGKEKD
jgi:hypothetical protein